MLDPPQPLESMKSNMEKDSGANCKMGFLRLAPEFEAIKNNSHIWRNALPTAMFIVLSFVLSRQLSLQQEWLYETWGVRNPLGQVICHQLLACLICVIVRLVSESRSGQRRVRLSWKDTILTVATPGVASGLHVAFAQSSVKMLTTSLFSWTQSTVLVYVLALAVVYKFERKSSPLLGTVLMIFGGRTMLTCGIADIDVSGLFLALLAALYSALFWTMIQYAMQKPNLGLSNPIDMMYYLQPWMLLSTIPAALWFEGSSIYENILDLEDVFSIAASLMAILCGGVLAFFLQLVQLIIVARASSLTLVVSGTFEEVCILLLKFDRPFGNYQLMGAINCFGGILLHVILKLAMSRQDNYQNPAVQSSVFVIEAETLSDKTPMMASEINQVVSEKTAPDNCSTP